MSEGAATGLALLCGLTAAPAVIGFILGRIFERRYTAQGWPWVIVPDFIRNLIERNL